MRKDGDVDLRGPAVLMHGSVLGGFKFYGPFETIQAAVEFWPKTLYGFIGTQCTIALLENPETLPIIRIQDGGK